MGLLVVTMSEYESGLPVEVAFGPEEARSLAQAFSEAGWTQFHVAETEKYAHVTYFFNGGVEAAWPGEERRLVPSPRVATYDLQPEMSAAGVTDELVAAIRSGRYDFIVANFANPDMVGHTGVWSATVTALEALDGCLGRIVDAIADVEAADPAGPGAVLFITADHGNADDMLDAAGNPVTKHSLNPVPLLGTGRSLAGRDAAGRRPRRRRADDPRARRAARLGRDDGPVAAQFLMLRATDDHRRARIARRHGLHPDHRYDSIEAATTAMTAWHATEPSTPHLSLHARMGGLTVADVEAALYDARSIVRTMAMRRTLWLVTRDLLPAVVGGPGAGSPRPSDDGSPRKPSGRSRAQMAGLDPRRLRSDRRVPHRPRGIHAPAPRRAPDVGWQLHRGTRHEVVGRCRAHDADCSRS